MICYSVTRISETGQLVTHFLCSCSAQGNQTTGLIVDQEVDIWSDFRSTCMPRTSEQKTTNHAASNVAVVSCEDQGCLIV